MPGTFVATSNRKTALPWSGNYQKQCMPSGENQSLSPEFIDILSVFTDEKVEYLLVGGYALGFHGYSRATGDIDLWVRRDERNAERVMRALRTFGAPLFDVTSDDFAAMGTVFQIGVPPARIDIMTDIDGVEFSEAWPGRKIISVEGLDIPLLEKALLLANKKATGRPKDMPDILWLEKEDNTQ